jgi:hypothetical protein
LDQNNADLTDENIDTKVHRWSVMPDVSPVVAKVSTFLQNSHDREDFPNRYWLAFGMEYSQKGTELPTRVLPLMATLVLLLDVESRLSGAACGEVGPTAARRTAPRRTEWQ